MVVDCGGGTVDITVHEISNEVSSLQIGNQTVQELFSYNFLISLKRGDLFDI